MRRRTQRLIPAIYWHNGFDILVIHTGAFGTGDGYDRAHSGLEAFGELIDKWKPASFIHGHSHLKHSVKHKRLTLFGSFAPNSRTAEVMSKNLGNIIGTENNTNTLLTQ